MPKKLPARDHEQLKQAVASGTMLENGSPHNDFFLGEFWYDLQNAVQDEITDPGANPARRHVGALMAFWDAIPADGVLTGVACNQPEIVAVALDAARAMDLPKIADVIARIQECIPAEVLALGDPGDRADWYDSETGQPSADRLERLEEEFDSGDNVDQLMNACAARILAEPNEFFRS